MPNTPNVEQLTHNGNPIYPVTDQSCVIGLNAPGTLDTDNTTAQSVSASEALSGTVKLHKVAKTGTYSDLIGTPTIPAVPTISTDIAADASSDTKTASPKAVKTYVDGKIVYCATETDYNNIQIKESGTLYVIPVSSS